MSNKSKPDAIVERAMKLTERDGIPFHKAISYVMGAKTSDRPDRKANRKSRNSKDRDYE
jgi:hypothetical protein